MILPLSSRRAMLGGGLAALASPAAAQTGPLPPFKSLTAMPVGCCFYAEEGRDPDFTALFLRNYSQVTPEFEMKMGLIARGDGALDFTVPDRFMAFAQANRLKVHGHTLVWYKHEPKSFAALDGKGGAFLDAYRGYVRAVAGRYRGKVVSWDVVNEPVLEDGSKLRDSLWSRNLGQEDHILLAFEEARKADPGAVLFLNEYGMEKRPAKRATFVALIERLLKRGAKIDGIGTQTHVDIDTAPGACADTISALAGFGLKLHVSEMDVSFGRDTRDTRSIAERRRLQAVRTDEIMDAFMKLPSAQRHALTLWGLRDRDSSIRKLPGPGRATDQPLPFDDNGAPKPMAWAIAAGLRGRS